MRLAFEACDLGLTLTPRAFLAALASVRTPASLKQVVNGMRRDPELRTW